MLTQLDNFPTLRSRLSDTMFLDRFTDVSQTADGIISGMEASTDASLDLPVSSGEAVVDASQSSYAGGTITLPDSVTDHCVWWDGSALQEGATWPSTAHAKICLATTDSSSITAVDNTVRTSQDALSISTERLEVAAASAGDVSIAGQTASDAGNLDDLGYAFPFEVTEIVRVDRIRFPNNSMPGNDVKLAIMTGETSPNEVLVKTGAIEGRDADVWQALESAVWLYPDTTYYAVVSEASGSFGICEPAYSVSKTEVGPVLLPNEYWQHSSSDNLPTSGWTKYTGYYGTFEVGYATDANKGTWYSAKIDVMPDEIVRLIAAWWPSENNPFPKIELSFDERTTWIELTDGIEVIPEGSPTTVEWRISLYNTDSEEAQKVEYFGAVWET